jgi:transposase
LAHSELASSPGHPFYQRLNELLEAEGFDESVEGLCAKFYAAKYGRPSLRPGIYFRLPLIGYFEGIDSERGIAWRLADSLALRRFVGIGLDEYTPDHSTRAAISISLFDFADATRARAISTAAVASSALMT